jgi:hypothetical protein
VGFGRDQGDLRLVGSAVEHTGAPGTCVTGRAFDLDNNSAGNRTCTPGAVETFARFFTRDTLRAEGCAENQADGSVACLQASIPRPN